MISTLESKLSNTYVFLHETVCERPRACGSNSCFMGVDTRREENLRFYEQHVLSLVKKAAFCTAFFPIHGCPHIAALFNSRIY